jgi:hypothetical protein
MSAQANVKLRYEHLKGEFIAKNENESLATLVEDAIGAGDSHRLGRQGKTQLRSRYREEFIPSMPAGESIPLTAPPLTGLRLAGPRYAAGESRHFQQEVGQEMGNTANCKLLINKANGPVVPTSESSSAWLGLIPSRGDSRKFKVDLLAPGRGDAISAEQNLPARAEARAGCAVG